MNKLLLSLFVVFFSFSLSFAQKNNLKPYHDNVVIIKVKPEYKSDFKNDKEFEKLLSDIELLDIKREFPFSEQPNQKYNKSGQEMIDISAIHRITYDGWADANELSNKLNALEYIEYAEPLYKIELLYTPSDPMNATDQYWLNNIRAYDAWEIHQGDTNIIIGISDTGTDLAHEDLIYNIKNNYNDLPDGIDNDLDGYVDNFRGWDFGDNDNNTQVETNNHGVYVCGIAGASTDNGIGVSGAGFKCKILPIKIMNSNDMLVNGYQSIVYAAEHNCDIVNCSWGGTFYQKMAQDVVNYATVNFDMLVVGAAGNGNIDEKFYPASYNNVLSVAATTELDEKWSPDNTPTAQGSSYSSYVDISAPGAMFKSTTVGSAYTLMWGGTSFASPIVAGSAGILRAAFPDYTAQQIVELIKISADLIDTIPYNIPFAGKLGAGRLNIYNALTMDQTPSIVFKDVLVEESEGELTIQGTFVNYLDDATDLTISVSSESEYVSFENETIYNGDLASLEEYVSNDDIIIYLLESTPYDYKLEILFSYEAGDYSYGEIKEYYINPGYKNIETDVLEVSITGNGRLGFSDASSTVGNGMILNEYFPLFYDCGIISGISATEVYSSVRQYTDFDTKVYPYEILDSENADIQIKTELNDSSDVSPLGLYVIENAYSWNGSESANFIILDYSIINKSDDDISDYYFGLFNDWDLVNAAENTSHYLLEEDILYCMNEGSQSLYAGVKLLSGHEQNTYAVAQIEGGDGIVDLTDGFADIEKYYMMSNSNSGYINATDIVQFCGAGPIDIPAGDTVVVGFAIIASESLFHFKESVETSQLYYENFIHPSNIENNTFNNLTIFPNPSTSEIFVSVDDDLADNYELNVYNILGEVVYTQIFQTSIRIDCEKLGAGIYNIEVVGEKQTFKEKIIIVD